MPGEACVASVSNRVMQVGKSEWKYKKQKQQKQQK